MKLLDEYFAVARERYQMKLRREQGLQRPWSGDPVLNEWYFCNVFREDDKTTVWFRENVRNLLSTNYLWTGGDHHKRDLLKRIVFACIAFRWFNRIEIGEAIAPHLLAGPELWHSSTIDDLIRDKIHPVVTGAYIIKGMDGWDKLTGVLKCIQEAKRLLDGEIPFDKWVTLEQAHEDLQIIPYMGPFMSYEVVSDLRWTPALSHSSDINLWANPGPGCRRGMGWVVNGSNQDKLDDPLPAMREILQESRNDLSWPHSFPKWEMREVEHWLCEFDKYKRGQRGDRLKRRYRAKS